MSGKLIGLASTKKIQDQRRAILLEIIMSDPARRWSSGMMAEEARKHPWFIEHMPRYGRATAHRDWLAIKEETKERREELAEGYLVEQLDRIDRLLRSVDDDLDEMGSLREMINVMEQEYAKDPDAIFDRLGAITKYVKAKESLVTSSLKAMRRLGELVPVEVPKQVNINQTHINIDAYARIREEHQKQQNRSAKLEPGYVDGDYEEME